METVEAEVLCSESDNPGLSVSWDKGPVKTGGSRWYRVAESMDGWFKGTYCGPEFIELSGGRYRDR